MARIPDDRPLFTPASRRGPAVRLLDLFSSVRLGIVLMAVLFVYSSVGSAGVIYPVSWNILDPGNWRHAMVRQWRIFEMTEFEWFHTWFFNGLIAAICLNIIVTTIRRIRFSALTAGVWMIHSGIIILAVGSFVYFGTKFEGDAPVIRRQLVIEVPGAPPGTLTVLPGNATEVTTDEGDYSFRIASIDPSWELLSEGDEGKRDYAVSVAVTTPRESFVRTLLAEHPHYNEDMIPGRGRIVRLPEFGGRRLLDESVRVSMVYEPQEHFWVKDSAALQHRIAGERAWSQRVIAGLPRYNDYFGAPSEVWPPPGETVKRTPALDLPVPPAGDGEGDALRGVEVRVTGYLRYAAMHTGFVAGARSLNPLAEVALIDRSGHLHDSSLLAFDPERRSAHGGRLTFDWVTDPGALEAFKGLQPRRLTLRVPEAGVERVVSFRPEEVDTASGVMAPLEETGWFYRISMIRDRLPLSDGRTVTLLVLDLRNPEGVRLKRWVFPDASRNRDYIETADHEPNITSDPDPRLVVEYDTGGLPATISVVAGPGEIGLHVFADDDEGGRGHHRPAPGETISLRSGLGLMVKRVLPDAREETRPMIAPLRQRDRTADTMQYFALVRVELTSGDWSTERWLPFHRYSFEEPPDGFGTLSRYQPSMVRLPDGRHIELMVSRERRRLPHAVALHDFHLTTHVGGFTGRVSSIRDWNSALRFRTDDGWSDPIEISTNNPAEFRGLWFFQSFWDAPRGPRGQNDAGSAGLNFTGLGIGNREGVYTQLLGCVVSVAGMLYAFYVKPIIRRRRRQRVMDELASEQQRRAAALHEPALDDTPIMAFGERSPWGDGRNGDGHAGKGARP